MSIEKNLLSIVLVFKIVLFLNMEDRYTLKFQKSHMLM